LRKGGAGIVGDVLQPHQQAFVDLLVRYEVVRFGEFTLKSGRKSPYFVNAGQLRTGMAIAGLGRAYAAEIARAGLRCDLVFGPSYKGVPLAVATAIGLADQGRDVPYGFDRKEAKDHGEGGVFVGTAPADGMRVVLVDDVITSGRSISDVVALLRRAADVEIAAAIVAVDRQERGQGSSGKTTLRELRDELGVDVRAIVTIRELVESLHGREVDGRVVLDDAGRAAIDAYLAEHGGEG
jgi:orotate phosphoribosyltransferase